MWRRWRAPLTPPRRSAPPLAVFAEDAHLLDLAEKALRRAGLRARCEWEEEMMELEGDEVGVWLDASGEAAAFSGADGSLLEAENQLLLAWTALEDGERVLFLPAGFTRAAEALCNALRGGGGAVCRHGAGALAGRASPANGRSSSFCTATLSTSPCARSPRSSAPG